MKTVNRSFASISVLELAAGAASLVLFAVTLTASAQTPTQAPGVTPAPIVGANGKRVAAPEQPKVLADPDNGVYHHCTTSAEREAKDSGDATYTPNPKAQLMTEEAAKQKGLKQAAHKVACKQVQ